MKAKSKKYPCPYCKTRHNVFYRRVTDEVAECICIACRKMIWLENISTLNRYEILPKDYVISMVHLGKLF